MERAVVGVEGLARGWLLRHVGKERDSGQGVIDVGMVVAAPVYALFGEADKTTIMGDTGGWTDEWTDGEMK